MSAQPIAAAAYFVVIAASYLLLPGVNEIPEHFPAATLWEFRMSSLSVQIVLWASIGLIFGYLVDRARTP